MTDEHNSEEGRVKLTLEINGVEQALVSKMWDVWAEEALHPASEESREPIKRIWYSAALSMFNMLLTVNANDNTDQVLKQMELMQMEMEAELDVLVNAEDNRFTH